MTDLRLRFARSKLSSAGMLMALVLTIVVTLETASAQDAEREWLELNNSAAQAYNAGWYPEAANLGKQALDFAREAFGDAHSHTQTSLNNLAAFYAAQGLYADAEPLFTEVLEHRRATLGMDHPDTLTSMGNLAYLYRLQGRYAEAEPLVEEALKRRRAVLGDDDYDTLNSMNNLARLYESQGRYGAAEPLLEEALQRGRRALGPDHPDILMVLDSLAGLYESQGRYAEAEPLYVEAVQRKRSVLSPDHPSTLTSLNNLAYLYRHQGRDGDAEPLYEEVMQRRRATLGPDHPDTLESVSNLAALYGSQGRYGESRPLFEEVLQQRRVTFGPSHPDTVISVNNLAANLDSQGHHDLAEPLYDEALHLSREVFGPNHPSTHTMQLNVVVNLVNLGKARAAVDLLREMDPQLLTWLGTEIYSTEAAVVRRGLVASRTRLHDLAISLALLTDDVEATQLATATSLRFKGLQAEEEAFLARIIRRGDDPQSAKLAAEVADLRSRLAQTFHTEAAPAEVQQLIGQLEATELALAKSSRAYGDHLQVRGVELADIQSNLRPNEGLLEISEYLPVEFGTGDVGPPHWAGALITAGGPPRLVDLGPIAETEAAAGALLHTDDLGAQFTAARDLYDQLLGPLQDALGRLDRLIIAPYGLLHLVPLGRLVIPDGQYLAESMDLAVVQTGRDLIRLEPEQPSEGLLAMGGIDFDAGQTQLASRGPIEPSRYLEVRGEETLRSVTEEELRGGFTALPLSGEEVQAVADLYRSQRPDEPVEVLIGNAATEARLKALGDPPRVLHLATHGFYREPETPQDRPMLLAGVALAGANVALHDADHDGILYAIEAQDLNLEGTELVVLSACETGQGQVGYGEGVYGLVRALRTAGARSVLVTLRPVGDREARNFMERFYAHWLDQTDSDPRAAFLATQRDYMASPYPDMSDPNAWSPFALFGA